MKALFLIPFALAAAPALAGDTTPEALTARFAAEAGVAPSVERGAAFFLAEHAGGKPETPSCATCHTADPRRTGQTRAGKLIEPLAPSANPARLTDTAEVEKWLGRNCSSVLGRECTPGEKADVLAWLASL
jgi:mono/diheme cytochrome c family protein